MWARSAVVSFLWRWRLVISPKHWYISPPEQSFVTSVNISFNTLPWKPKTFIYTIYLTSRVHYMKSVSPLLIEFLFAFFLYFTAAEQLYILIPMICGTWILPTSSILLLVAWFSCPSLPCLFCQHVVSAAVMYRGESKWPGGACRERGGVLLTLQQWTVVSANNHVLRLHRPGLPAPTHRKG